jgi:PTS system nitrogen regulatory IIA component
MKLSVSDAAAMLSVPESALLKSIRDGSLSAYKSNHQLFLARAELLEWATAHDATVPPEALEDVGVEHTTPSVADAIARGGIVDGVPGSTPDDVLEAIARTLPIGEEEDRALVLEMLLARQAQCTTAIGHGIAFPHTRSPVVLDIDEPIVVIGYLAQPVAFGALDGEPVRVVFAFVTPTIRAHHRVLSRLAHLVHDARFVAALRERRGADVLVPLARQIEGRLDRVRPSGA